MNYSLLRRHKTAYRRATFLLIVAATFCSTTKHAVVATCPAIGDALRLVIIGNSYTGGTSVGRACDDDEPGEPACHNMAVPGDVANFDIATYPGIYNRAPDASTLIDPSRPYHPSTNPHRGDVPGKMKLIAEHICGAYLGGPGGAEPSLVIDPTFADSTTTLEGTASLSTRTTKTILLASTNDHWQQRRNPIPFSTSKTLNRDLPHEVIPVSCRRCPTRQPYEFWTITTAVDKIMTWSSSNPCRRNCWWVRVTNDGWMP